MKSEGIVSFDILLVNLYPFEKTVNSTKDKSKIIEMIDIGGHSLISSGKNFEKVLTITDPSDYKTFMKQFPSKGLKDNYCKESNFKYR